LAREILINAGDVAVDTKSTFRRWDFLAGAVNKLKDFENDLVATYPPASILRELLRIAHREFGWQRSPNQTWIGRYWHVYRSPGLSEIVRTTIGITIRELYLIGLSAWGHHLRQFALRYPPQITISGLTTAKYETFLGRFGRELSDLRIMARQEQQLNDKYAYIMNPLRRYPVVRCVLSGAPATVVPIPTFLVWRITEGLYYELYAEPTFATAYGEAVQNYVGEVARRATKDVRSIRVHPEAQYEVGKQRKDTVDWILEDDTALVFIECKGKRLRMDARLEISSPEMLEDELRKLGEFIVQTYKTINDYRAGLYPRMAPRETRVFPVVVTLEEWFAFGPEVRSMLDSFVRAGLVDAGLSADSVDDTPYSTCSVVDFERLVQVIAARGGLAVMSRVTGDEESRTWLVESVLRRDFPVEYAATQNLFPGTVDDLIADADAADDLPSR
jgi:hypothetical protein